MKSIVENTTKMLLLIANLLALSYSHPVSQDQTKEGKERQLRQTFHRNRDGSITASLAASETFNIPGNGGGAFDVAQTINIGPKGVSFGGGQSFSSDIGGNHMTFGNSNSQSSLFGPGGFSSTGANSNSNSFSNPFFQSSNAQANAFANQFSQNNPFQF